MTDYVADTSAANDLAGTRRTARQAEPKLKAVAEATHEAYDSLKDVAVAAAGETRDKVRDVTSQAVDRIQHRYGDLQAWVQLRPTQALGVAAAIGVFIGLLLRGGSTKTIYLRDVR
jgi:ElaB/YqjD/DUF883 family membrane-anchored ribosome-binding protein